MAAILVTFFIGVLGCLGAAYALFPPPGSSAAGRQFAIVGSLLIGISLLSIAGERARRRKGLAVDPARDLLEPGNRRESYRILYPEDQRPILTLQTGLTGSGGGSFEVIDVSEEGLRFCLPAGLGLNGPLQGEIRFPQGECVPIAGEVVRRAARKAALRLSRPLPAGLMVEEQLRLRKRTSEPPP